jgi:hypothetical protein
LKPAEQVEIDLATIKVCFEREPSLLKKIMPIFRLSFRMGVKTMGLNAALAPK